MISQEQFLKYLEKNLVDEITFIRVEESDTWLVFITSSGENFLLSDNSKTLIRLKFKDIEDFCRFISSYKLFEAKLDFSPSFEIK